MSDDGCFCDGNGGAPCWSCGGEGLMSADCGDDLCTGNECIHGEPERPCDICDGRGEIACPHHEAAP